MDKHKNEIRKKLQSIYSQVLQRELKDEEFEVSVGLLEKFHIDSLIALQIVVKIEQDFGIVIEDDSIAIEMLNSLGKAVDFISENSALADQY